MGHEGAISGQQSAISSAAVDPLTNARCPQCGYSLRGLPENRCPECGRPFDPAEFTGTFLPRWPQLMAWYLAACIIAQLLDFAPALLRWNPYLLLAVKTGDEPLKDFTNIWHLAKAAAICLLGPVCIIGLYRRRDWARKGCIIIFALGVLAWLSYLVPSGQNRLWVSSFLEAAHSLWFRLGFEPEGPIAALVTLFLLTGLRRISLSRTSWEPAPVLSLRAFRPKRDWLLLGVTMLIGLGVGWSSAAWSSLEAIHQWDRSRGITGQFSQGSVLQIIALKIRISLGLCTVATALVVLSRPPWLRLVTGGVLVAWFGIHTFEFIIGWQYYSFGYVMVDSVAIISDALPRITTLMPYLALAAFAFLAISKDDIRRLKVEA